MPRGVRRDLLRCGVTGPLLLWSHGGSHQSEVASGWPGLLRLSSFNPPHSAQQKRPRHDFVGHDLFLRSNFRLIATMRSRSKKGEVGLCCAQSCDRPEPIAIMVLPTEYQPESLNRCVSSAKGTVPRLRVLYRPLGTAASGKRTNVPGSETIHDNRSSRKGSGQHFLPNWWQQTLCRDRLHAEQQTSCHAPQSGQFRPRRTPSKMIHGVRRGLQLSLSQIG